MRILIARPRLVVAAWIVLVLLLAVEGRGFGDASQPHPFFAPGSASMRAHEIAERRFGNEEALIVMVRGPAAEVREQGRELAASLGEIPEAAVVSPWAGGKIITGLEPRPGVAALIVRFRQDEGETPTAMLPPVEDRLDEVVSAPVEAYVAGLPVSFESFQEATEDASRIGELLAVPILLIVLLLVFRSVLAAVLPILSGGTVVIACQGVLTLVSDFVQIDSFALGVVSMLGLALGVDYSLLVVSRYREERAGRGIPEAVATTVAMTARSILPAGAGLVLAGVVVVALNPTALLASVGIAVVAVTLFSVLAAVCVVPAALVLLGDNLDRWALPPAKRRRFAFVPWFRSLSRSRPVAIGIGAALLLLAAWSPTLASSIATPELLPAGNQGRVQMEAIEGSLGPGWVAPFEVMVDGVDTPVTTARRLDAMVDFQQRAERIPGVETVAGFGGIEGSYEQLKGLDRQLEREEHSLVRLDDGIERAARAAGRNTEGLRGAAAGATQLAHGVGEGGAGAGLLAEGLRSARSGSSRLGDGLGRAQDGSTRLADASSRANREAGRLSHGLEQERRGVGQMRSTNRLIKRALQRGEAAVPEIERPVAEAEDQLAAAWRALEAMTVGRGDPEYAAAVRAVQAATERLSGSEPGVEGSGGAAGGVHPGIDEVQGQLDLGLYLARKQGKTGKRLNGGAEDLIEGAEALEDGLERLAAGNERLTRAIAELAAGGVRLSPALARLVAGTEHLQGVLEQLSGGAGTLASGLAGGADRSVSLAGGLRRAGTQLDSEGESQLEQVQERSPGMFDSGYFLLAGLDGAPATRRDPLGFLVALDQGGVGARMMVVPSAKLSSPDLEATRDRLEQEADGLARETGTEVAVGGLAGSHIDIDDSYQDRIPVTRLALALVTMLVLLFVIRSLTMAVIASLLNLLTVTATFGLLSLLFDDSLLGGPGYVDTIAILATVLLTFGLAADYETFVFARMREEYDRTGSPREAVDVGLDRVAPVITGAAVIMIAVFLAFSVSAFVSMRNLGVAQAIGIFIDAFVMRLILIPALMHALGPKAWWMPAWLDRLLPGGRQPQARGAG
ncbi:MAG TPA: MMPL family transporter [Solirubrobacterales bacterium]|nr:MMPL family transporter [Solirubrobacterales bacterium]